VTKEGGMQDIAIFTVGELFGGVERQVMDLHAESRRRTDLRYRTYLFHDHTLAAALREADAPLEILPTAHRYDARAAGRAAAAFRRHGHQVVHAHGYRAMVTLAAATVAGRAVPPVVKTEHGLPELGRGLSLSAVKTLANHRLDRWATHRLDAVVCYVTDDIRRHYDDDHRGLQRHTVRNGIPPLDRTAFPRPDDLPTGSTLLGIVGRISEVKGIEHALAALGDGEATRGAHIAVIGTGPLEAALKTQAAAAGLQDRIHFLGFRTNIYDYLAHIDALLMPSLHEGLPYTLLEAMSLGKPVLASDVGGLAEVLRDNETGLLFPAKDPAAIARAVRRLVEEPDLGPRLGAAAAREQRARYTLDAMLDRYVEIYREAIERRRA